MTSDYQVIDLSFLILTFVYCTAKGWLVGWFLPNQRGFGVLQDVGHPFRIPLLIGFKQEISSQLL